MVVASVRQSKEKCEGGRAGVLESETDRYELRAGAEHSGGGGGGGEGRKGGGGGGEIYMDHLPACTREINYVASS